MMKLWQAILIGCDRRAQEFNGYFVVSEDGGCKSCALGAAWEATFGLPDRDARDLINSFFKLPDKYPILRKLVGSKHVCDLIVVYNDVHRWPREKIALEFVKPLEEGENDE